MSPSLSPNDGYRSNYCRGKPHSLQAFNGKVGRPCASTSTRTADPRDLGRGGLARRPHPRGEDGNRFAAFAAAAGRAELDRHRDPAGRPRPLPLLRGTRAAVRRARSRRGRVRLLRPHRRRRQARRRVRLHAARAADDAGRRPGRHRGVRRAGCATPVSARSSPSASASAAAARGRPRPQATGWPEQSASTAGPAGQDGSPGRRSGPASWRRRSLG